MPHAGLPGPSACRVRAHTQQRGAHMQQQDVNMQQQDMHTQQQGVHTQQDVQLQTKTEQLCSAMTDEILQLLKWRPAEGGGKAWSGAARDLDSDSKLFIF